MFTRYKFLKFNTKINDYRILGGSNIFVLKKYVFFFINSFFINFKINFWWKIKEIYLLNIQFFNIENEDLFLIKLKILKEIIIIFFLLWNQLNKVLFYNEEFI